VDHIAEGELWRYELKLDGYGTIAIKEDCQVDLFSRNGNSFNSKFPYVYLQKHDRENPVIDLTHIENLRGAAERPFVQSAVALPYQTFGIFASAGMDGGFVRSEGPAFRYPTAVIKLLFPAGEIRAARPEIDSDYLFPKSDRLYQALIKEQAAELAIYA